MHAVALAQELGISEVIVPPDPGGFSAWGMLQSAVRQDFSEPYFQNFADLDAAQLDERFLRLGEGARTSLVAEGVSEDRITLVPRLDMRYQGQEHTLTVNLPTNISPSSDDALKDLRGRFEDTYRTRYGHSNPEAELETVNLRLTALGDVGRPLLTGNYQPDQPSDLPSKTSQVLFTGGAHSTGRYHRENLPPGCDITGPAIMEEATATTVIPPGGSATIDRFGCLLIEAPPL